MTNIHFSIKNFVFQKKWKQLREQMVNPLIIVMSNSELLLFSIKNSGSFIDLSN